MMGIRVKFKRIDSGPPEAYVFVDSSGAEYVLLTPLTTPVAGMGRDFWDRFYDLESMVIRYRGEPDGRRVITEVYRYD